MRFLLLLLGVAEMVAAGEEYYDPKPSVKPASSPIPVYSTPAKGSSAPPVVSTPPKEYSTPLSPPKDYSTPLSPPKGSTPPSSPPKASSVPTPPKPSSPPPAPPSNDCDIHYLKARGYEEVPDHCRPKPPTCDAKTIYLHDTVTEVEWKTKYVETTLILPGSSIKYEKTVWVTVNNTETVTKRETTTKHDTTTKVETTTRLNTTTKVDTITKVDTTTKLVTTTKVDTTTKVVTSTKVDTAITTQINSVPYPTPVYIFSTARTTITTTSVLGGSTVTSIISVPPSTVTTTLSARTTTLTLNGTVTTSIVTFPPTTITTTLPATTTTTTVLLGGSTITTTIVRTVSASLVPPPPPTCQNSCAVDITATLIQYPTRIVEASTTLTTAVVDCYITQYPDGSVKTSLSTVSKVVPTGSTLPPVWTLTQFPGVTFTYPTTYVAYTDFIYGYNVTSSTSCESKTGELQLPAPTDWSPLVFPSASITRPGYPPSTLVSYLNSLPTVIQQLGGKKINEACDPVAGETSQINTPLAAVTNTYTRVVAAVDSTRSLRTFFEAQPAVETTTSPAAPVAPVPTTSAAAPPPPPPPSPSTASVPVAPPITPTSSTRSSTVSFVLQSTNAAVAPDAMMAKAGALVLGAFGLGMGLL